MLNTQYSVLLRTSLPAVCLPIRLSLGFVARPASLLTSYFHHAPQPQHPYETVNNNHEHHRQLLGHRRGSCFLASAQIPIQYDLAWEATSIFICLSALSVFWLLAPHRFVSRNSSEHTISPCIVFSTHIRYDSLFLIDSSFVFRLGISCPASVFRVQIFPPDLSDRTVQTKTNQPTPISDRPFSFLSITSTHTRKTHSDLLRGSSCPGSSLPSPGTRL